MTCSFRKIGVYAPLVAVVVAIAAPMAAAAVTDTFTGTTIAPYWTVLADDPATLSLEQNDQLNVLATGPGSASNDAIYLSNGPAGFRLKTDGDFLITIDYAVTSFTGTGSIALDLGVGKDLDGQDSAAIGFMCSSNPLFNQGLGAAYRINDVETSVPINYVPASGTLLVQYEAATDTLTLGLNDANEFHRVGVANLVRDTWDAESLWVSFGARGQGLVFSGGNATLDNLNIVGHISEIPEPTTLALILTGGFLAIVNRRRRRSG
ncbi:MAG: PEP-CTERM sorting domain-containing protein [Planctomycetaceae bacterium]|nr:PEP-CTERM sorting domain-containing protein [Planctomycetaceae bacterium]